MQTFENNFAQTLPSRDYDDEQVCFPKRKNIFTVFGIRHSSRLFFPFSQIWQSDVIITFEEKIIIVDKMQVCIHTCMYLVDIYVCACKIC